MVVDEDTVDPNPKNSVKLLQQTKKILLKVAKKSPEQKCPNWGTGTPIPEGDEICDSLLRTEKKISGISAHCSGSVA